MLNIEGRPSHLPDNSRKPTTVLDGGGGWGVPNSNTAASYHHLQYQSPAVLSGPGVEIYCVGNFIPSVSN